MDEFTNKDYMMESLKLHYDKKGKIQIMSNISLDNKENLALAYTPGVAFPCLEIEKDSERSYELTRRGNLCLVVTDGSAVLGLGDIGPLAAMPVMEGKCILFKEFGGVDAFPLCINSKDVDEIVRTIKLISGSFGGINLEDISAPRCFEIEKRLQKECDIPVFHDDQHGTAIVTLAGLINALKIVGKSCDDIRVVVNGAGAAAIAIAKLLLTYGVKDIIICDTVGAIYKGRVERMNPVKEEMAELTNIHKEKGDLKKVIAGADVFIGVSAPNVLKKEMVENMANDAIVFACANPEPEIYPDMAKLAGARIVATGRSDFPNQINNVLAFPGIFRGLLDVRAKYIDDDMKISAAEAIASLVDNEKLREDYIIPDPFDKRVCNAVAAAVAKVHEYSHKNN